MKPICIAFMTLVFNIHLQAQSQQFVSTDIANFWKAYDKIQTTTDSATQVRYLQELYIDKGSAGLKSLLEVRNYTAQEYVKVINQYPAFWKSIRKNTLTSGVHYKEISLYIDNLKKAYPELKPSTIYFLIGAFRTPGTIQQNRVLIGTEYSLGDASTYTQEFPKARQDYYSEYKPRENIALLCTHEYIHTQQKEPVDNLLSYCLYEGVAEFLSSYVSKKPSNSSSISFGIANHEAVVKKFQEDMYFPRLSDWLWGENTNELKVRDLGYYIGYSICERFLQQSSDKKAAIKKLIELDFTNDREVEKIVDVSKLFPLKLEQMLVNYNQQRPTVISVMPLGDKSQKIKPGILQYSVTFSEEMDINFRGFDYGPLGEEYVYELSKIIGWSEDHRTFTLEIKLKPNKKYQTVISSSFRNKKGFRLKPYLVEFETGE